MRKWLFSLFRIAALFEILKFRGATSFVKQLLKQPARIDKNDIWSRSMPMVAIYGNLTLALSKSLKVPTPSYVQILSRGILSITSFSLLRKGSIMQFDLKDLSKSRTLKGDYLWPNELAMFADKNNRPILLVPDGFLLPGQNDGGLYAIRDPHTVNALPVRITGLKKGWFYHRAVHVKLPTGQEGILTARAKKPIFGRGIGELVWLSLPADLDSCFPAGSTVHDTYGSDAPTPPIAEPTQQSKSRVRHTTMNKRAIDVAMTPDPPPLRNAPSSVPWVETILAEGPDVMFEVLDLDPSDDCLEVISAHFFGQKLSVHSIKAKEESPFIEISAMKTLDTIGRPYGLCLATMSPEARTTKQKDVKESVSSIQADYSSCDNSKPTHLLVSTHECSYDLPSAYNMALSALGGIYPSIITGASFAFRNSQQSVRPGLEDVGDVRGGSLFSYEIPRPQSKPALAVAVSKPNAALAISTRREKIRKSDTLHDELRSHDDHTVPRVESAFSIDVDKSREVVVPCIPADADIIEHTIPDAWTPPFVKNAVTETETESTSLNWKRQTLFRGFKVCGWGGIFSPGAPGFPYVFRMPNKPQAPPLILLAGDCTGSAYVFAPRLTPDMKANLERINSKYSEGEETQDDLESIMDVPNYELAFEIQCGSTVGSAAVAAIPDGSGDVEIFVPSYELSKVHIFRLSDND